jgi:hypothetical protein
MGFSEFEKAQMTRLFDKYSERRIPPHVRDKIRLEHRLRGDSVTLFERRPPWRGTGEWSALPVAQFRRNKGTGKWSLYWADRNSRWHVYEGHEAASDLETLLGEVDRDPTGIFWG